MTQTSAAHSTTSSSGYTLAITALRSFYATWRAAAVYEENNNGFRTRRAELSAALSDLFASGASCVLSYQNDYIFFNGERLNYDREFSFGRSLASRFADLKLGMLTIDEDAPAAEIDQALFALATADRRAESPYETLTTAFQTLGLSRVRIGPLAAEDPDAFLDARKLDAGIDARTLRRTRAQALFQRSEAVVQEFWDRVRDRNSFAASSVQRVVHQMIDEIAHDEEILLEFASLKEFDEYTFYHSVNVAIYSIAVGMRLGFDRVRLAHLGMAALFHDIGKVKLPLDLITKPDEYNDVDWEQIRRHPTLGALTLASMRPLDAELGKAMAGAFEHHLKSDLSGYPRLSRTRTLHQFSRIITICDSFDAMTSGRVYQKESISPDEAVRRLLYNGRRWYDPVMLKAFVHVVGIFPVGTVVGLSDGSKALVTKNDSDDLYSPEVLIIRDAGGAAVESTVRLRRKKGEDVLDRLHIVKVLDAKAEGLVIEDYLGAIERPEEVAEFE